MPERTINSPRPPKRVSSASNGICVATTDGATLAIRELAERQHGVVARRQLIALGIGIGLIESRVKSGRLVPLHCGVFALGHGRAPRRTADRANARGGRS